MATTGIASAGVIPSCAMIESVDIEDRASLVRYLQATKRIPPDEQPAVRNLAGGVSNKTVLVMRPRGGDWVIKQALAKLRVQVEWFSDPSRIAREAEGMRWLNLLAPAGSTTKLIFEDQSQHLLAMQAVPQPHENYKQVLLRGQIDVDMAATFGELLGGIHREADRRLLDLAKVFGDRSFFESLRLEPYYLYAAEQVDESRAFMHALVADTRQQAATLVHGDYSPKNVLIHDGRLVLLDHEVIHLGDPAFDVGFALTHFLSKAHHMPARRERMMAAAAAFADAYFDRLGRVAWRGDVDARASRHLRACLLARVAGRSPLEYLSAIERRRQQRVVVAMMHGQPMTLRDVMDRFIEGVESDGGD